MTERLTSLAAVKDWLSIQTDGSDEALTRLIEAASQFVLTLIGRDSFGVRPYVSNFRGIGRNYFVMPFWPVRSISTVGIGGSFVQEAAVSAAGLPSSGYVLSDPRFGPQTLELYGYSFYHGAPSLVRYEAGFRASQSYTIPGTDPTFTPTAEGLWINDLGVTIDGTDAVKVDASPAAGQYSVDGWGKYTFSTADSTKEAIVSYDYVPLDVSQAVTELVGEWWKRKDRIGILSKTLGGQETITYAQSDMSAAVRKTLQPYMNVVPF